MIDWALAFLKDENNRTILQWLGGGLVVMAPGCWAVFTYFYPKDRQSEKSQPSGPTVITGQNLKAKGNVTINSTVTIGPDGKEINSGLDDLKKQNSEIMALVTKLIASSSPQTQVSPGLKEAVAGAVQYAERGAEAGDSRLQQALDLLKQNKTVEANALFGQVAEAAEQAGRRNYAEAAAAYRHQGAIALLHEPWKARYYYAKSVELDPSDADGLSWDGWLQLRAGSLAAAEKSYRALLQLENKAADAHQILWARYGLGDIFAARGNLPEALKFYHTGLEIAERLVSSDASHANWRRDLSASHERIGDVLVAQGDLYAALESYRASLEIRERLASSDASHEEWRRDLSVSHNKIGNILFKQGALPAALTFYRAGLEIAERLAASDPSNTQWRRDVSVSHK